MSEESRPGSPEHDARIPFSAPAPAPPEIPRYEIRERLGEGATSIVYRAWDRELNRPVAIKMLREIVGMNELARQRFHREAHAAASLAHPNLVTLYDAGEANGRPYLVMELVEGRPLSELLKEGRHGERELLSILLKVMSGVASAHERGVVHRDLKPANILIGPGGEPKVADFGLAYLSDSSAELTKTGTALGTPLYMSPEQVGGRPGEISPRTDVFALGAILYEMITGRPPHVGESIMEIYGKIAREEPESPRKLKPSIPKDLETLTLKALEKEPARRYPGAGAYAGDLRRYLDGEPIEARPVSTAYRLYRRIRKNVVAVGLGTAALAALAAAAVVWRSGVESARGLRAEREARVRTLRDMAHVSLEAALKVRRTGDAAGMSRFLPPLRSAYEDAVRSAPDLAEVEYFMGRMYRALMDDAKALTYQESALRKDPEFGPALYERVVLVSRLHRGRILEAAAGRENRGTVFRDQIVADLTRLLRIWDGKPVDPGPFEVGGANLLVVKGILACHHGDISGAQSLLRKAVNGNPLLEEGWEMLAQTILATLWQSRAGARKEDLYREMEDLYTQALAHDRGYLPHWTGRGFARSKLGQWSDEAGKDASSFFEQAEADYAQALSLDAGSSEALEGRGLNQARWAQTRYRHDEDPSPQVERAIAMLDEALKKNREDVAIWYLRGRSADLRGHYRFKHGGDPRADYTDGERHLTEALARAPKDPSFLSERAEARSWRGRYRARIGEDPLPDYRAADEDFSRCIELQNDLVWALAARAEERLWRAEHREKLGTPREARADYTLAAADYEQAVRLDPSTEGAVRDSLKRARQKIAELPPD